MSPRCFLLVLLASVAVSASTSTSCSDLRSCVGLGLRNLQATTGRFPLLGRRLMLERRPDAPQDDVVADDAGVFSNAARLLDTHDVRARITDNLSLRLFKTPQGPFDISLDVGSQLADAQGRTFFKRRLQMALLPIMYKLGVMTTLLGVLVVMVAKGLTIGVILLILGVSSAVKHKLLWGGHGGGHSGGHYEVAGGWSAPQPQGVHLHLHGLNKEQVGAVHSDYHHSSTGYAAARNDYVQGPYNPAAHFAPTAQQAAQYVSSPQQTANLV